MLTTTSPLLRQVLDMMFVKLLIGTLIPPTLKCYPVINQHNVLEKAFAWVTFFFNYINSSLTRCIRMICPNLGGNIHKFIVFNLFSTQPWVKMSPPLKPSINVMDTWQDTSRDAAVKLCPLFHHRRSERQPRETRSRTKPAFHLSKVNTNRPFGKTQAFDKTKSWLLLAPRFLIRKEMCGVQSIVL